MDFENAWMNCREETPPTAWRNKAQYSPSCYSSIKTTGSPYSNVENDTLYIPGNDIPSYSNVGYGTSPKYSNIANYTPEMCMPNKLNGNIRYPSYHPHMAPIRYRESLGHNCHLLYNGPRLKAETDANSYYCQLNQHQHMKMCPQAYMPNNESNMCQMKPNTKKKRKQRNEPKFKIADTLNSSINTNEMPNLIKSENNPNSLLTRYENIPNYSSHHLNSSLIVGKSTVSNLIKSENDTDSFLTRYENIPNYSSHHLNSSPIVGKSTTETNIFSNESNIMNTQTYLQPMKDEICESQTDFQSKFNLSCATNDVSFKMNDVSSTISNQEVSLSTANDETKVNSNKADINCSKNNTTNRELKDNSTYVDNSDLPNPPIEEIPQEEPMHQVLNIDGSTLENSNMNIENIIFQSIFEGKDENGEDVIVLFVTPANEQGVSQENVFDTSVNGEGIKIINNQDITTNSIEFINFSNQNNLEIDAIEEHQITDKINENLEENHSQIITNEAPQNNVHILNQQNESVIISNVNDFFLEEVVDESSCLNTKRTKDHKTELAKNIGMKKNRYKRKKYAKASSLDNKNISKSTQFPLSLTSSEKLSDNRTLPEHLPRNYRKFNMKFKTKKLKWKRHFQWKSNTHLNSLNNMYFSKIRKCLRHQYKGIRHDVVWIIMKIILDKIGGSVLQSIYSIIQLLAKTHMQKTSKEKTVNSVFKKI